MPDAEIRRLWADAMRHHRASLAGFRPLRTKVAAMRADQAVTALEAAGVTEADIDRLFPFN